MRPCTTTLSIAIFMLATLSGGPQAALAQNKPSSSLMGSLGLNTVPSARMNPAGTVRAKVSGADPYIHSLISYQLAAPLYVGLRQTAQSSDLRGDADRLYPGLDIKLRLLEEGAYHPEISVGLNSAFGHRRHASEYLTLSKRYHKWDFTGGMAWGRLGTAAHMENPLGYISDHFDKARDLTSETANDTEDWFTGRDVGFFAGFEYDATDYMSFKAEWGADRYIVEQQQLGLDAPDPWAVGIDFHPEDFFNIGVGLLGGERIYASLSFQNNIGKLPLTRKSKHNPLALTPRRSSDSDIANAERSAANEDIVIYNTKQDGKTVWTVLEANDTAPLPRQMGRAARHLANNTNADIEQINIIPFHKTVRGPVISLMRNDLEDALIEKQGSPQEIWRSVSIHHDVPENIEHTIETPQMREYLAFDKQRAFKLILDQQLSLSEEDAGFIRRTGVVVENERFIGKNFITGEALRIDVTDNLEKIDAVRSRNPLPTRGDIADFADRTLSLDRLYTAYLDTLNTDLFIMGAAGYLEEFYSGFGGEILYRPFDSRFAVGADLWLALKRDPNSTLNLDLTGDSLLSGHINGWYEIPETDLTLKASFGRYLAEDIGATLSLEQTFNSGLEVKGFVTATDQADFDVFGGSTHLYSGLEFRFPFGKIPFTPVNAEARLKAAPIGRNTGQKLDAPFRLYDVTTPLSLGHISRQWTQILE